MPKKDSFYFIAEISSNHNGSLSEAKKLIKKAKECGAHAVKFQTYDSRDFVKDDEQYFETSGKINILNQFNMFKMYELKESYWNKLQMYAKKIKIDFFTTPSSTKELRYFKLNLFPFIKIGSDDFVYTDLIEEILKYKNKLILSTGMASLEEIDSVIKFIKTKIKGPINKKITIMHCVSLYPASLDSLNLATIDYLQKKYSDIDWGYSDHAEGDTAILVAASKNVSIFEKHFTLNKKLSGPDHKFSCDPSELKDLIKRIRMIKLALGSDKKLMHSGEIKQRNFMRRRAIAAKDLKNNSLIRKADFNFKRASCGIFFNEFNSYINSKLNKNIAKGQVLKKGDIK